MNRRSAVMCCLLLVVPCSIFARERVDRKENDAALSVRVRDSSTGAVVHGARAEVDRDRGPLQRLMIASSSTVVAAPQEKVHVRVIADNYAELSSDFVPQGGTLPVTFLLDPVQQPEELRADVIRAKLNPEKALIHGHVVDDETGEPIAGASVHLRMQRVSAKTDHRGYFAFLADATPYNKEDDVPTRDDIIVEHKAHRTYQILNAFLAQGTDTHYIVELQRGSGVDTRDDTPKLQRANPFDGDDVRLALPEGDAPLSAQSLHPQTDSVTLPTNIRLGYNCSCTSCSSVVVLARGTYVKRGLNDEWIASWNMNSLRAGAVAYRSYGCYYAQHPISANYDICNNACCQVNDSDTSTSTSQAVDDTSGVVVTRDCSHPAAALYSAEDNGCHCSNGYAGYPGANWPCILDGVCSGYACNGHGMGMCQWGTQRHAANQGWAWTTIVDHYFNNGGGLRNARRSTTCP